MFLNAESQKPRVIAHRGARFNARGVAVDENTIPAFRAALDAGADILETDLQLTKDGIPVLFHDDDLLRLTGKPSLVRELTMAEVSQLRLEHGGSIPTLEQALKELPEARFNLDFKVDAVIAPACRVISNAGAQSRVLLASFSGKRLRKAKRNLSRAVFSLGSASILRFYLAFRLGNRSLAKFFLQKSVALQIPTNWYGLRFDTQQLVDFAHSCGAEVHFWVVNSPAEMLRIALLGADGIVTDFPLVAKQTLMALNS